MNEFENRLNNLSVWKQIAFMAYCCERMVPNFRAFCKETGVGDESVLRNALDAVWNWVESKQLVVGVGDLRNACERQAPDTSVFSSLYTSAALDAANAVAITLDAIERFENAYVIDVSRLARDSIDLYVQESTNINPGSSDFENRINAHPLMHAELERQLNSFNELSLIPENREIEGRRLRKCWSNLRVGTLGDVGVFQSLH